MTRIGEMVLIQNLLLKKKYSITERMPKCINFFHFTINYCNSNSNKYTKSLLIIYKHNKKYIYNIQTIISFLLITIINQTY